MADVRSVDQRLTQLGDDDKSRAFEICRDGMLKLAAKLYDAFEVQPHPSSERFADYGDPSGKMKGSLTAYSGPQLDWVIDSWIASPQGGFSNHHLTIWLPSSCPVPHLGMAIGTIPQLFFFIDLVPRGDLWVDLEQLDRYHEPFNEQFLQIAADERFRPFVSRETYIRQAISPIGLCIEGEPVEENFQSLFSLMDATLTRWIAMVKEAEPTPEAERAALGKRDEFVRRTICERDPANVVAEKVLGADMTQALVEVMWGANRSRT